MAKAQQQSNSQAAEHLDTRPGQQKDMQQQPQTERDTYVGSGKLSDRVAIITGGDSGIGRAVAAAYAKEGADIVIVYLSENEDDDAAESARIVSQQGRGCLLIRGDLGDETFSQAVVEQTLHKFGHIDVLVNNASEQYPQDKLQDITAEQLERTFRSNIFSMFFLTKAVVPRLSSGGVIINTASVTAYKGSPQLLDYSATKGAIVGFTRSLALSLAEKGIRVNAVAPGPIWTPLIPSTFSPEKVKQFGTDVPLGRPGQPEEVAPAYVYLASEDSSYVTGQVIHVNGGTIVNA